MPKPNKPKPKSTTRKSTPSASSTNRPSRTRLRAAQSAPRAPAAPVDDARLPTLAALRAQLGESTEREALALLRKPAKSDLVLAGADVATARITTDCRRVYALASQFLATATDAQRAELVTVTPAVLRTAVWAASEGDELAQALDANTTRAAESKTVRTAAAGDARKRAMVRRTQLIRVLNALYGDGAPEVSAALGTVDTPEHLDASIHALLALARTALADRSADAVAAREGVAVTAAWLDETAQLGDAARDAGETAATGGAKGDVTQGTVDYWDGINLRFFQRVVRAFEAGHQADPTIPTLQPLALRSAFGRPKKRQSPPASGTAAAAGNTGGAVKG